MVQFLFYEEIRNKDKNHLQGFDLNIVGAELQASQSKDGIFKSAIWHFLEYGISVASIHIVRSLYRIICKLGGPLCLKPESEPLWG